MGRSPCCDKVGLKKGPWTPEEDQKLLAYIEENGHGSWRALPAKAGLQRCGKSCRLRWTNYLRPDIKRGKFSLQEEQTIIQLHALLGNRWSAIATHLPKRTDNEIKNYWNTHLKKRLAKMGIDPVTHKPKNDALLSSTDGQSKNAANLSHMAQWESARLEAEARLVRESKLRNSHNSIHHHLNPPPGFNLPPPTSSASASASASTSAHLVTPKAWNTSYGLVAAADQLESPTSTLTFSENVQIGVNSMPMIEFVGTSSSETGIIKEEGEQEWKFKEGIENSLSFSTSSLHDMTISMGGWTSPDQSLRPTSNNNNDGHGNNNVGNVIEEVGFTNLLLNDSIDRSLSDSGKDSDENSGSGGDGSDYYEDNKNYWNSILNLVNSSPSDSPMF
ncbi:hypothetical protein CCACVL1_13747 [Corchorus capsularis]|uniref:Uncharacterized protein n=1 Tax=Corchorus capsularis TaxID=210143 RepID=A0A1R3I9R5_COCAP|nr:hypothetical protein CCACVL1_13747 [Corchorus capsularis]